MAELTIPSKNRLEWKQIVTGELQHNYSNFVLQMKVHQANKDVSSGKKTVNNAISEIYDICLKYSLAVQTDCKLIFKTW